MIFSTRIADNDSQNDWDDYIKSSSQGTIFHTWRWLKIMEKHTDSTLYPLQVFKGASHIANYPIFVKKTGIVTFAFSPPNNIDNLYMGPVFSEFDSLNQYKKEEYLCALQSALDNFLFSELRCNYVNLRLAPDMSDTRSLLWAGYTIEPFYTYRLDLRKDIDDIWAQLHRTVRKNIKSAQGKGVVIEKGNRDDLSFILSGVNRRFTAQGKNRADVSGFIGDIFDEYHGNNLEIDVAKYQGETVSGVIHLSYNGIVYQWVGLPKSQVASLSPNDLLVWECIQSAHKNGQKYYEIMDGGNNPRLRNFKSKFNPDISFWCSAEKYSHPMYRIARNVCRKTGHHINI